MKSETQILMCEDGLHFPPCPDEDAIMGGGVCYTTLLEDEKASLQSPPGKALNQQSILRNILVHNLFMLQASPGLCCMFYCKCGGIREVFPRSLSACEQDRQGYVSRTMVDD